MTEALVPCLRVAGAGLILLALLHATIGRRLKWREEVARMSPLNAAVFHVRAFFVCLVLVGIGLPSLVEPGVFFAARDSRPPCTGGSRSCGRI